MCLLQRCSQPIMTLQISRVVSKVHLRSHGPRLIARTDTKRGPSPRQKRKPDNGSYSMRCFDQPLMTKQSLTFNSVATGDHRSGTRAAHVSVFNVMDTSLPTAQCPETGHLGFSQRGECRLCTSSTMRPKCGIIPWTHKDPSLQDRHSRSRGLLERYA